MRITSLTRSDLIFCDVPGTDGPTFLRALSDRLCEGAVVHSAADLYKRLLEREELGSTGIGDGVAIPHCKLKGLQEVVLALGIASSDIDFGATDGKPVRIFFVLLSPHNAPAAHLQALASVSRWLKEGDNLKRLRKLTTEDRIFALLSEGEPS